MWELKRCILPREGTEYAQSEVTELIDSSFSLNIDRLRVSQLNDRTAGDINYTTVEFDTDTSKRGKFEGKLVGVD